MSPPRSSRPSSSSQVTLLPSPLPREVPSSRDPGSSKTTISRSSSLRNSEIPRTSHASALTQEEESTALDEPQEMKLQERELENPPFEPFFTLVDDTQSSSTYHPAVHYMFSDDDGDILNETLLRLSDEAEQSATEGTRKQSSHLRRSSRVSCERYVVITLNEDGRSVESAHSLSDGWQVLSADVSAAPMLEGEEGETGGLMLRVQGTEGIKDKPVRRIEGDIEGVIELFRERMDELKRVVEAGRSPTH